MSNQNTNGSCSSIPTNAHTPSSIPTGATHEPARAYAHTQLDHLGALCNHLEEASECFAAPPSGVYSDDLRRRNLAPEGEHKLPSPCSVTWDQRQGRCQWVIHFLLEDFMEVIAGLFADGRLNAFRQLDLFAEEPDGPMVYLAGKFDLKMHHSLAELGHSCCYELGFTPETMGSIRLYALASLEDLGNIRAVLARYGVQLPEEDKE